RGPDRGADPGRDFLHPGARGARGEPGPGPPGHLRRSVYRRRSGAPRRARRPLVAARAPVPASVAPVPSPLPGEGVTSAQTQSDRGPVAPLALAKLVLKEGDRVVRVLRSLPTTPDKVLG